MKFPQSIHWSVAALVYTCAIAMLGGCGASMPGTPVHGKAAGQWAVHMPSTPSPFASMAYGKGGSSVAAKAVIEPTQLDAYLKPQLRHTAPKLARTTAPAPVTVAKAVAPQPAPQAPIVASAQPQSTATATAPSDAERYAQRDAASKKQQEFKAGDVVVISVSTILIVALVVVLLVLLLR